VKHKAAVIGDNCLDCYCHTQQWFPGGNAVNVGVYLRRLGLAVAYCGVVGDDDAGGYLREALNAERVDLLCLKTVRGPTGRTCVEMREGDRHFVSDDPGVQVGFRLSSRALAHIRGYDVAHFSGFTSWEGGAARCHPSIASELRALWQDTKLSLDFSDTASGEELFSRVGQFVDYSFFSRDDRNDAEVQSFVQACSSTTGGVVVVMRGPLGSAAGAPSVPVQFCPAPSLEVVDTLGAGDAFIAGFLAAMLDGDDLQSCLQTGTRTAAEVLGQEGAWVNEVVERRGRSLSKSLPG